MIPSAVTRVVALPLLVLLHLVFSLVSLVLRVSQSVLRRGTVIRRGSTPRHIALSLPSRGRKIGERSANSLKERRALLETLKRTVRWAGEDGVRELSVYTDLDLEGISADLQVLLKSPKSPSYRSTPSSHGSSTPPDSLSVSSSASDDNSQTIHGSTVTLLSSPSPRPRRTQGTQKPLKSASPSATTTIRLQTSSTSSASAQLTKESSNVILHLLPKLDLASVAMKYAQSGTPPSQITVQSVDADIRTRLDMETDPELLIIHPLTPLNPLRALLPRPAPELSRYPFWHLRITEIYQCPQPLPFTTLLAPLVYRLRTSSLPALIKIGFVLPLVPRNKVTGAMRRQEWDGALDALGKVEQRLGK